MLQSVIHHRKTSIVRIFPDDGLNREKCCENAMSISKIDGANCLLCSTFCGFALGDGGAVAESAETGGLVIVDHACRLHEGIANGCSDELAAVFLESAAHGVGDLIGGGR